MQPVPGYKAVKDMNLDFSMSQLNILVFVIYLVAFLFFCQLLIALHNIWAFLIKQQKYKTSPLVVFYVIAVLLTLTEIYYSIWILYESVNKIFFAYEFKPILMINMGLIQCWIMLELSLRLKLNIRITEIFSGSNVPEQNIMRKDQI